MKVILIVFPENSCLEQIGHFWAQKWRVLITLDLLLRFFVDFAQWQEQELHKNCINGLSEKKMFV